MGTHLTGSNGRQASVVFSGAGRVRIGPGVRTPTTCLRSDDARRNLRCSTLLKQGMLNGTESGRADTSAMDHIAAILADETVLAARADV